MKLVFEVIPEDLERNLYYVDWKDTVGQSGGYQLINRPEEVWCVITNVRKDTLGYYQGLSSAQSFATFQSKDTIVTLNFMIGPNFFAEGKAGRENIRQEYTKGHNIPILFKLVRLNLKTGLRKKYEIIFKQK